MTRLVERAPAGEIFAVQAVADVALAEIIREVLLVQLDGFFGRERFAVHQLRAHHVRVSPNSRSTDVDGVRRHFPAFRAAALDSFRFAHARPQILAPLFRSANNGVSTPFLHQPDDYRMLNSLLAKAFGV